MPSPLSRAMMVLSVCRLELIVLCLLVSSAFDRSLGLSLLLPWLAGVGVTVLYLRSVSRLAPQRVRVVESAPEPAHDWSRGLHYLLLLALVVPAGIEIRLAGATICLVAWAALCWRRQLYYDNPVFQLAGLKASRIRLESARGSCRVYGPGPLRSGQDVGIVDIGRGIYLAKALAAPRPTLSRDAPVSRRTSRCA